MKSILALALMSGFVSNAGALLLPKAIAASEITQVPALTDTLTKPWNRPTVRLTLPTSANQIQFSGDGNTLLTDGGQDGKTINLWNLTTGKKQSTFSAKAGFVFCGAALSADGQFAAALLTSTEATASPTKRKIELQVWNLKTGKTQWNVPVQDHTIQSEQPFSCQVEFSPNSRLLATSIDGAANKSQAGVRIWNVPQGTLQQVTRSTMTAIAHLSFSQDSSFLGYTFEMNNKSQLHLWNLRGSCGVALCANRTLKANLSAPRDKYFGTIANFRFDLNQQDAIAYVWDGELISYLYRWQIKTGKLVGTRELPLDRQDGLLAVSLDGQTYVYGGQVTGYHIGDLQTRQSLNFPQGLSLPMDQQKKVVFSPDGQQIAISYNETITILR
ncbi:WD40 repeat domain-containing protein [Phormidesmis priestleyi]